MTNSKFASLDSIKILSLPNHIDKHGVLTVIEGDDVPFNISRIFTVRSSQGSVRGKHAHKRCSQLMICISGNIEVMCDNGQHQSKYILDKSNIGLLVPPGIWAQQTYLYDNSILMVLCDMPYDASDYIHTVENLIAFRTLL